MAFTKLEADLNIIQKLDDEPNDVGGLSAAELKARFDEAGNRIQGYLNGVLLPELESAGAAAGIGARSSKGQAVSVQTALDAKADLDAIAASGRLPTGGAAGGVLQKASAADYDVRWGAPLSAESIGAEPADPAIMKTDASPRMSTYLTLSGDPVQAYHAATKQYVDGQRYRPNLLLNGTLGVWRAGESVSASGGYAADLWQALSPGGNFTVSRAGGMRAENRSASELLQLRYSDGHTCRELGGRTLTLSLELGGMQGTCLLTLRCGTRALVSAAVLIDGLNRWTVTVPEEVDGALEIEWQLAPGASGTLRWIKLEEGTERSDVREEPYFVQVAAIDAAH